MKFRMWLAIVCVAAVAASGLTGTKAGLAQDDLFFERAGGVQIDPRDGVSTSEQPSGRVMKVDRHVRSGPWEKSFQFSVRPDSMHEIEAAAKALHDAKDDEAKSKAQQKLSELLNKYFDDDMQRREEELVKIETRLKSLRSLLEKRREKQREIVELQIQVLLNEADGLGFFNNALPPGGEGWPTILQQNSSGEIRSSRGWIMTPPQGGVLRSEGSGGYGRSGGGVVTEPAWPEQPPAPDAQPGGVVKPPRAPRAARPPRPRPAAEPEQEALEPPEEAPATDIPVEE